MAKKLTKSKVKSEELCDCEGEHRKHLEKIEVMNEEELNKFLKGAKVEEEFNF